MRLMDAEVEGVMSRCSRLNQVNADQVAQASSLNTVKATPKLNRLCNLNGWDLKKKTRAFLRCSENAFHSN